MARMSAARCPRCATHTLVPGHEIHVCTACGGVWLDAERARRLLAPLGADLQQSAAPQTYPVACPMCGHGMYICLTRLAGVEIDVCAPHGVWFDRHELERVSQAVSRITGQPVPQAPPGWAQAQPPAGHGVSVGPGLVAGAAVIGVAAAGAAAYATLGGEEQRSSFGPVDGLTVAPDVASTGFAVADSAGDAGELAHTGAAAAGEAAGGAAEVAGDVLSGAAEAGADAAEAAGSILGGIFEAIGSIFS
jgi:Zn-finger nucleic acid-binding protein